MNPLEPDLFAKLMSLPDGTRMDLFEFLGASPVGKRQLSQMINELEESFQEKRLTLNSSIN